MNKKGVRRIDAAIMQSLPVPVILLNRERQVIDFNGAAEPLLSETPRDHDLALSLRHPRLLDGVDKVLDGAPLSDGEFVIAAPVAQTFQFTVTALKEKKHTGFARALIMLNDITSIRATEQMHADFVANVSHELRSPLSTLIGFIETLRGVGWNDDEARKRFLAIMDTEAHRMKRLIDDLLSLSKVEVREHVPPRGAVDLGNLIDEIAVSFILRAKKRNMELSIQPCENLPRISGDHDELSEVFTNLFDNALKYGEEGHPVTVTLKKVDRVPFHRSEGVSVVIANQGDAIPAEQIPRLTERFYRVDKGRSRDLGGTGLGLAIVKHIVSRHRGRLSIRSKPDHGTSVTVTLPCSLDDPAV
ncbi:cell wall metabolism sensor histidine kinase WalK [Magnetospira sp. QH-2]|uniref:sensor histidine kinase n=1 Tax=Magnetospira sp. (strain QH-2) TaxID=1288970 RepID=UPI0011DE3CFC|nr:ATP-binding protein [Magnetospira sp. QH-2]